jgi:CAAX amino terminal protease family.
MTLKNDQRINIQWYNTLSRVLLFCMGTVIILVISSSTVKNLSPSIKDHLSILSATILTFFLIVLFLKWENLKLLDVGIIPGKYSFSRFFFGYIIGLCMAGLQVLAVLMYGHLQLKLVSNISFYDIITPLLLYFLIACREELAFRSYSLRSLNISIGSIGALSIIGAIFIVEHIAGGMSWKTAILGSGSGAILFGVSALKTKGLALSLGLHSAWNFGQWTFGFKNGHGIWETVIEKGYESKLENVGLTVFLFIMGIATLGICLYYRKYRMSE